MDYFLQQAINGLQIGFVYALIALGYTMVYGVVRLINFAHGDVFMVGAFIGLYAIEWGRLPLPALVRYTTNWSRARQDSVTAKMIAWMLVTVTPRISQVTTSNGRGKE